MFRNISLASLPLVLLSSSTFASESETDNHNVHGRSVSAITANLADYYDIEALRVETWGDKIVVHTQDENGANRILFVDKDTLRPITDAAAVASRLDLVEPRPATAPIRLIDGPSRSLIENDD